MSTTSTLSSVSQSLSDQLAQASNRVVQAIKDASARAGVEFSYMLSKAQQESSLNPSAKASTSSATGLYQFVEQTWLRMVKTHGDKYGLSDAADKITIGSDGVARVKDAQSKQAILSLRNDPCLSADMAAELTCENKSSLQKEVGGKIGSTELYLAHFLGASGASDFLKSMKANPDADAASVLPQAASANSSVFYDKSGQPKSLSEVYDHFAQKFQGASTASAASTSVASSAKASLKPIASSRLATTQLASAVSTETQTQAQTQTQMGQSFLSEIMTGTSALSGFASSAVDLASASPLSSLILAQSSFVDTLDRSSTNPYADQQKKKQSTSLYGFSA